MHFYKKYPKLFKVACYATIASSAGWLCYQIKKTGNILNNALDISMLSKVDPTVYKDPYKDEFLVINAADQDTLNNFESGRNSIRFALAKHLLSLASNENQFIRTKAIRQLARVQNLNYWQFQILSSMMDARTAVGLARSENANSNFFIEPRMWSFAGNKHKLEEKMKELLINLHARSQHPCMGYVIAKAFRDVHDIGELVDHDSAPIELTKFIQSSKHDKMPMCLESLLHHASIKNYGKDIAELNGLSLLMEIYKQFKDNWNVTATICRIISYLSMHRELLEDIFKCGWIGILAEWIKHEDVRIAIPAAKALANLDVDDDSLYKQRLYPLHPVLRRARRADADVVFIHGLMGGVFFTWRQRNNNKGTLGFIGKTDKNRAVDKENMETSDPATKQFIEDLEEHLEQECICHDFEYIWEDLPINADVNSKGPFSCPVHGVHCKCDDNCYTFCWPRDWLAEDCENLRIVGVNYETNLSLWTPICPSENVKNLEEKSDELIDQMGEIGLGKRPIIWVTHSMGGLIIKNVLCKAYKSEHRQIRDLCLNTKGVVFYSTPHVGSSVATLNQASALILWPSVEVRELEENSQKLLDIHDQFLEITKKVPIKLLTFVETKSTAVTAMKFKFLVVQPRSGNPGVGEYYEIPQDHLGICKPANRWGRSSGFSTELGNSITRAPHSFLYQKVLHFIREILTENRR